MRLARPMAAAAVAGMLAGPALAQFAGQDRGPGPGGGRARPDAAPLVAGKPIAVPGGSGAFDRMAVDTGKRRLLAAHRGAGSLTVLDLKTDTLLPAVATGAAQGIAIDTVHQRIFVGDSDEKKVVVLDRGTLEKRGEIALDGPVDAMAFDPKTGVVYADQDDGTKVWLIDGAAEKLTGTVTISGAPEFIEYDPKTDRLYQNIKTNDTVQVIDPKTNQVVADWKIGNAQSPHGLAVDTKTGRLFTAGRNGTLTVMDLATGKPLAEVAIGKGVDQIAFDPGNRRIYCACAGEIWVAQETKAGANAVGKVAVPAGAHTLAVDPSTHAVWTCYSDDDGSYLLKLTPKSAQDDRPFERPTYGGGRGGGGRGGRRFPMAL